MVIDSSALIAILEAEPEAEALAIAIEKDTMRLISAVSVVETTIVIENRRGSDGGDALNLLLEHIAVEIIPVTAEQAMIACQAFRDFGKGRHPAKLCLVIVFPTQQQKFELNHYCLKGMILIKQIYTVQYSGN